MNKTKKKSAAVLLRQRIERHDCAQSELIGAAHDFVAADKSREYERRRLFAVAREYAAAVCALAGVKS